MRAKVWFGALLCSVTAACAAQESSAKVVPAPEQIALAVRIDALAAKLARSPVAATGNLCFSPSAVAATLAMLQPGMKDPVRARIDGALLAEGEDLAGALASLRALSAIIGARKAIELRQRQLAWFDAAVQFDPQWLAALAKLEVPCEPFLHDDRLDALPERMRAAVAAAVGDAAAAALQMQGLRPDTRLVLVDALHLRARWREDFVGANGSGVGEFAVSPQQRIKVTYLKRDAQLPYGKVGDDQVVRLDLFAAGLVVDFALPPADGDAEALPAALQNLLEGDWGAATPRLRRRQVELKVPSFEIARTLSLEELTIGCGCGKPELRVALAGDERFGIVGDLTTRFSIGKFGIGATSVSEMYAGAPGTAEPRVVYLTFDRPFAFAVRDTASGLVLVCGIVREPPAMRSEEPEERDR
ncbi:MAG: serpin family protein [Planctomycetota bacterium]